MLFKENFNFADIERNDYIDIGTHNKKVIPFLCKTLRLLR